jgi:hypothetical protein
MKFIEEIEIDDEKIDQEIEETATDMTEEITIEEIDEGADLDHESEVTETGETNGEIAGITETVAVETDPDLLIEDDALMLIHET